MGSGIAQVCAQAGYDTVVREVGQPLLDKGFGRVDSSLARIVKAGKMTEDELKGLLPQGFDGFLKKPFHVRQVIECIEDATAVVY